MTPDSTDPVERAHLKDPADRSHTIARYAPEPTLSAMIRHFWIPTWDTAEPTEQRVLQYPVCLVVVSNSYAHFVGPNTGLGREVLSGRGWAFGAMLQPAAGAIVLGAPVSQVTDARIDLVALPAMAGVVGAITEAMSADPRAEASHRRAIEVLEDAVAALGPPDREGTLVNEIVDLVETTPELRRVRQLTERVGLSERTLQRLLLRRIGLTPKWLINRRRLHELSERLRTGEARLADVAAELGYADQAHLSRDFKTVTSMTPGEFAARHRNQ